MTSQAWNNLPDYVRDTFPNLDEHVAGGRVLLRLGRESWAAGYVVGYQDSTDNDDSRDQNPYVSQVCEAVPFGHCCRVVREGYRLCPDHYTAYTTLTEPAVLRLDI